MLHTITKTTVAAVFASILLFTASCKKDSAGTTVNPAPSHQILKVEQDADNYITFDYNADNLLTKVINKQGGTTFNSDLSYNADKTVATASLNTVLLKYFYNTGILARVEYHDGGLNGNLTYAIEFTNQNGKITEQNGFAYSFNNPSKDYKIQYNYNAAGDLVTEKQFLWNLNTNNYFATESMVYEYDNKPNPLTGLQGLSLLPFDVQSAHNVTKETLYDTQNQVIATHTYTYTYNAAGYPLTATEKTTSQSAPNEVTTQVKYTYKN